MGVNCWDVLIIIGEIERFCETAEALVSYLLSQYVSWIRDWGTAGDALTMVDIHRLDEPFASEAIHSVPDGYIEWSETNTQVHQFFGGVLCPHHPALFVLLDSIVKEKQNKRLAK